MIITEKGLFEKNVRTFVKILNKKIRANRSDERLVKALKEVRQETINLLDPMPYWAMNPDSIRDDNIVTLIRRFKRLSEARRNDVPHL